MKQSARIKTLLICILSLTACSQQMSIEDCPTPVEESQLDSFKPPLDWSPNDPVLVMIDSRFTEGPWGEQTAIIEALEEWNAFSKPALGGRFFKPVVTDLTSRYSRLMTKKDDGGDWCSTFQGNARAFAIVKIDNEEAWSDMGFSREVNAVTLTCTKGKQELDKTVVLLNTAVVPENQVRSVATHEVGHALGLQHSCCRADQGEKCSKFYQSCDLIKDKLDHPHRLAVMYPTLSRSERLKANGFVSSEEKNTLQWNDEHRAFCRYHHLSK